MGFRRRLGLQDFGGLNFATPVIDGNDGLVVPPDQGIAVGDMVRVDEGDQTVFEKTRVRAIEGQWVFVEASKAGAKMSDVTLLEKATADEAPPTLEFERKEGLKVEAGEEMDRFTVDEGVVKIVFPSGMTADSVEELEQFLNLYQEGEAPCRSRQKAKLTSSRNSPARWRPMRTKRAGTTG